MENIYDKPKLQITKAVVSSPYGCGDGGQPDEDQSEQQQQQLANHSSDNAEIAHCLNPFSHPDPGQPDDPKPLVMSQFPQKVSIQITQHQMVQKRKKEETTIDFAF